MFLSGTGDNHKESRAVVVLSHVLKVDREVIGDVRGSVYVTRLGEVDVGMELQPGSDELQGISNQVVVNEVYCVEVYFRDV